jgi:hypothetical protein
VPFVAAGHNHIPAATAASMPTHRAAATLAGAMPMTRLIQEAVIMADGAHRGRNGGVLAMAPVIE